MDHSALITALRTERDELAALVRYYEDLLRGARLPAAVSFRLSAAHQRMLALLVEHPSGCTQGQFYEALYFDRAGDTPDIGVVATQLSHMEARLRSLGILIERSVGQPRLYRLAAAGRKIIAQLLFEEASSRTERIKTGLREYAPQSMFGGAHAR